MNTNNKEAIELLEAIIAMTQKESVVIPDLARDAIKLLQDNEDTEVQETPRCGDINCNSTHCVKPSSKVEKLKELRKKLVSPGRAMTVHTHELVQLIDIIEDEE